MNSDRAELYLNGLTSFPFREMEAYEAAFTSFFANFPESYSLCHDVVETTIKELSKAIEPSLLENGFMNNPRTLLALLSLVADQYLQTESKVSVKICDWQAKRLISDLKPEDSNQFLKLRGIVVSVSDIETMTKNAISKCTRCSKEFPVGEKCPDCRSSNFVIISHSPELEYIQRVEIMWQGDCVTCFFRNDLVDTVCLGQVIDVTGVVEICDSHDRSLLFSIDVNYAKVLNGTKGGFAGSFIGSADIGEIQDLSTRPHLFAVLVNSIGAGTGLTLPARALVLLTMFSTREDTVHLLFNKKFDTSFVSAATPHSIIFDETVQQGLSSTRRRDQYVAGMLATANDGILMISDVDRFRQGQLSFLETVQTKTERIDPFRTVSTCFSSVVISDPKRLDEEVFDVFSACIEVGEKEKDMRRTTPKWNQFNGFAKWDDKFLPMRERLRGSGELVPLQQLLKYVTYARQFVQPKWSDEAKTKLIDACKKTYDIRKIKNLAQCRARCELRDTVTDTDVEDVTELLLVVSEKTVRNKGPRLDSRKKLISDFMTEFTRIAKYNPDGVVDEREMKEIAGFLPITSKFAGVDDFINMLSINNYILSSGSRKYRPGNATL